MASPSCDGNKNIIITGRLTPPVIGMSLVCGSGLVWISSHINRQSCRTRFAYVRWHGILHSQATTAPLPHRDTHKLRLGNCANINPKYQNNDFIPKPHHIRLLYVCWLCNSVHRNPVSSQAVVLNYYAHSIQWLF